MIFRTRLKNVFTVILLFVLIVLFSGFQQIFSNTSRLLNPAVKKDRTEVIIEERVLPLLAAKENTLRLSKPNPFVKQANATSYLPPVAAAGIVDSDSGEVIFEKNFSQKLPIASLTKIMSAVVTLDLAKEDELFVVSDYAAHQIPTRIGVIASEKLTVEELLNALLLTSANDAATVLQEGIDKKFNAPIFVKAMNEKAALLGLTNTSFANPQGFDDEKNYSTVEDLTVLTRYALNNYPLIKTIVKKDYEFLPPDQNHKQFDLYNWNGLVGVYPSTIGMKIGNTEEAGKTTIVISSREGKQIMAIVLGASDIYERDLTASQLLDIGYERELELAPVNVTREELRQKYLSWRY